MAQWIFRSYGGEATDSIYKDILLTLIITPFTHKIRSCQVTDINSIKLSLEKNTIPMPHLQDKI